MNINTIAVVGMSHLGLITSLGLASLKKQIISLDADKKIIKQLQNNQLQIYESGLSDLLSKTKNNINFSNNFSLISQSNIILFAQDTATDGSGSVKKLDQLISQAIPYFKKNSTIICMSQVPIGYYRNLLNKIKKIRPELNFYLYHLVDTIIMTNAIERFLKPERIIIGSHDKYQPFSSQLKSFLKLFHCPIFHMSYESAELTKASINLYLANTVTFANTLSDFCENIGADINDIIPALKTDKRIGPYAYLRPTLRIAGGHLERDLFMLKRLAKNKNISPGIVKWIINENNKRYIWARNQIDKYLITKNKKKIICIWGLSYKKNTNSTTNAASIKIIKDLNKNFNLHVYDPMAILPKKLQGYTRFEDKYQALKNVDCLLIITEWDEFTKINLSQINQIMKNHLIIDCVGILTNKLGKNKNFTYITMGDGNLNNLP